MPHRYSDRRRRIFEFILSHTQSFGYGPTFDEIKQEVGLASKDSVFSHLRSLEQDGYIERKHGRGGARMIRPLKTEWTE